MIPRVSYTGSINRGFQMSAECRGSGPSVYIFIEGPDASLQRLRFDTPIPVVFRIESKSSLSTDSDSVRVNAMLSDGYMAATNRVRIGMGLADAAGVTGLITSNARTQNTVLVVEIAGSSGIFDLAGARDVFAGLKRTCEARKL